MGVIVQRHGDVGMAHDVLQSLGVHTGVCHTGTERVPEGVWGDIGQWLLVLLVILLQKVPYHIVIDKLRSRHNSKILALTASPMSTGITSIYIEDT